MSSLMALWMGMKVIPELLQGRGLYNLYEGTGKNGQNWNINDGTDDLRINLNHVALNCSLKDDPMVLILNHLYIPKKTPSPAKDILCMHSCKDIPNGCRG